MSLQTLIQCKVTKTELLYFAFRIAFRETQERILLARQFPKTSQEGFGYLTEIPFFQQVKPEIQLNLIARLWERFSRDESHCCSKIEESIVFAACERAISCLAGRNSRDMNRFLRSGPVSLTKRTTSEWQSLLWMFQVEISPTADYLQLGELSDLPPEEADCSKNEWGLTSEQMEPFFDVLSEWRSSADMYDRLTGLLTFKEIEAVRNLLRARSASPNDSRSGSKSASLVNPR